MSKVKKDFLGIFFKKQLFIIGFFVLFCTLHSEQLEFDTSVRSYKGGEDGSGQNKLKKFAKKKLKNGWTITTIFNDHNNIRQHGFENEIQNGFITIFDDFLNFHIKKNKNYLCVLDIIRHTFFALNYGLKDDEQKENQDYLQSAYNIDKIYDKEVLEEAQTVLKKIPKKNTEEEGKKKEEDLFEKLFDGCVIVTEGSDTVNIMTTGTMESVMVDKQKCSQLNLQNSYKFCKLDYRKTILLATNHTIAVISNKDNGCSKFFSNQSSNVLKTSAEKLQKDLGKIVSDNIRYGESGLLGIIKIKPCKSKKKDQVVEFENEKSNNDGGSSLLKKLMFWGPLAGLVYFVLNYLLSKKLS